MEIEEEQKITKPHLPFPLRWEIVNYKKQGWTNQEISRKLSIPESTCSAIYRKYLDIGDIVDLPKSGRSKKLSDMEENMLIETVQSHPKMSLDQLIEESNLSICKTTGWNVLQEYGFECKTAPIKWTIDEKHKKARLKWAKRYRREDGNFWKRVIFSDESKVQYNKKKQRYWIAEENTPEPIQRDRWQESLLLWGAISYNQNCILEIMKGTMDSVVYAKILKKRLLKNYPRLRRDPGEEDDSNCDIFQHDGSKVHVADIINSYFEERNIKLLSWPPKSPDINIIENLWAYLKNKLKASYSNTGELEEDIVNIWENIPSDLIENLYDSIPERIQAVIDSEGGPTMY